jgi:hypothetical protein
MCDRCVVIRGRDKGGDSARLDQAAGVEGGGEEAVGQDGREVHEREAQEGERVEPEGALSGQLQIATELPTHGGALHAS